MKIKPLKDRIFVEQIKLEKKTKSGIILVADEITLPDFREYGKVIAVGSKVNDVKVGDVITFGRWARIKTHIEKKEYLVIREKDVLWKE